MAHWSYLRSCTSEKDAVADFLTDDSNGTVELEARYSIPLFWFAAFGVKNIMRAPSADAQAEAGTSAEQFVVLCASGVEATNRLRARAAGICKLLPEVYAPYFEDWIRFVKTTFPHYIVLRAEDIFLMEDLHDAELRVTAALTSLARADEGKSVKELDALDYFGSFRDLFSTRPADEEPAFTAMRLRTQLAGFNGIDSTALNGWPRSAPEAELNFIRSIKVDSVASLPPEQARLAATIRDGTSANTIREGVAMAAGNLSGRIPLGADAPTKLLRKTIGGGGELLELLRSGFLSLMGLLLGPVFLWVGFSGVIQWSVVAIGFGLLGVGVFLLRAAVRAFRNLRTIMRA